MSNDTYFNLTFVCPSREMLEHVLTYLQRKKARWEAWKERGKRSEDLLERTGASSFGAVVSWGFDVGEIEVGEDGEASVTATAWANQNSSNVWIGGEQGELADLLQKFPFLEISGRYKDGYGDGEIEGCDQC